MLNWNVNNLKQKREQFKAPAVWFFSASARCKLTIPILDSKFNPSKPGGNKKVTHTQANSQMESASLFKYMLLSPPSPGIKVPNSLWRMY